MSQRSDAAETRRPSFTLGVTGNMDLAFADEAERDRLVGRLETILLFLRFGFSGTDPRGDDDKKSSKETLGLQVAALMPPTPLPEGLSDTAVEQTAEDAKRPGWLAGFEDWDGLGDDTELVLLSSLAPGADTLVVEVFRSLCESAEGFSGRVRAPLPFPADLYREATTFNASSVSKDENDRRRAVFDRLIEDLPPDDHFLVYLAEDFEVRKAFCHEKEFRQTLEADRDDPERRDLRYQAAGEYVATFSDLLIAVYDDRCPSTSRAGSKATVESKRRGATYHLLPFTDAYSWSDNGPVFHLYHPREKMGDAEEGIRKDRPFRILHPYDLGPDDVETREAIDDFWEVETFLEEAPNDEKRERFWKQFIKWQRTGNLLTTRIARNLARFNAAMRAQLDSEEASLDRLCRNEERRFRSEGEEGAAEYVAALEPVARVQSLSSDCVSPLRQETDRTLNCLFLLSFFAALCLHVFAHWHPLAHSHKYEAYLAHHEEKAGDQAKADGEEETEKPTGDDHGKDEEEKHEKDPVQLAIRILTGFGALGLAIGSLVLFRRHVVSQREERQNDTRAFSEALRIQFYWALAGLRRTVAGNYMQRVRSEMDWIRNAVSSMVFPLERFREKFLGLDRRVQSELIEAVVRHWVGPPVEDFEAREAIRKDRSAPGQENYFFAARKKRAETRHLFHGSGSIIALAGVFLIPFLILGSVFFDPMMDLRGNPAVAAGLAMGGIALLYTVAVIGHARHHGYSGAEAFQKLPRYRKVKDFFHDLIPHHDSSRHGLKKEERKDTAFWNFVALAIPAVPLTMICLAFALGVSAISAKLLPGPLDLGIILAGACLLGGALLAAYAEKKLLAELTRQFGAAGKLFFTVRIRLEEYLVELKEQLEDGSDEGFDKVREKVQDLLFAIGREALDENSEWLILHRARPMEPVMAG